MQSLFEKFKEAEIFDLGEIMRSHADNPDNAEEERDAPPRSSTQHGAKSDDLDMADTSSAKYQSATGEGLPSSSEAIGTSAGATSEDVDISSLDLEARVLNEIVTNNWDVNGLPSSAELRKLAETLSKMPALDLAMDSDARN